MGSLLISVVFLLAWILLAVYFFYTLVAIKFGAAPVPLPRSQVNRLIELADIKAGTRLVDLGSGDGRVLLAAAQRGAVCTGLEINPLLCWYSRFRVRLAGYSSVSVVKENFWHYNLKDVDVLTVFLVPHLMEKLSQKVRLEMRPGSTVLVARYPFPHWNPVRQQGWIYMYRV